MQVPSESVERALSHIKPQIELFSEVKVRILQSLYNRLDTLCLRAFSRKLSSYLSRGMEKTRPRS